MTQRTVELSEELPGPDPLLSIIGAKIEADLMLMAETKGRKTALRWLRLFEDSLAEDARLERVVLIRGEALRVEIGRCRRVAFNWMIWRLPDFLRRVGGE